MILVDTNLLVYSWNVDAPEHEAARTWLQDRLGEVWGVGLPWASLLGFVRIVSNPRIFDGAESTEIAWKQVDEWLGLRNTFIPEPADRHAQIMRALIREAKAPSDVPDAHLAALAIEHGLTLQTADRGFARFPGLKWENPLG